MDYDLIVIGDAREGLEQAISAAQSGGRAAVIASPKSIPSLELMRRAANNVVCAENVTLSAWRNEIAKLGGLEERQVDSELNFAGVDRISGNARFIASDAVEVRDGGDWKIVSAPQFVVACGAQSLPRESLRIDDRFIFNIESIHKMIDVQRSVIVVGAGETGSAAAIMLATLGLEVTLVDEHVSLLEVSGLLNHSFDAVSSVNIAFRLGEEVIGTEVRSNLRAVARLASGQALTADAVLVCVGREGATHGMNLEAFGVGLDERGRLWCDANGQSWNPDIAAVGEVVGFPRSPAISNVGRPAFSRVRGQLCS